MCPAAKYFIYNTHLILITTLRLRSGMGSGKFIILIYRENGSIARQSNSPKFTQLGRGRAGSESETCGCRAHDLGPEAVLSL